MFSCFWIFSFLYVVVDFQWLSPKNYVVLMKMIWKGQVLLVSNGPQLLFWLCTNSFQLNQCGQNLYGDWIVYFILVLSSSLKWKDWVDPCLALLKWTDSLVFARRFSDSCLHLPFVFAENLNSMLHMGKCWIAFCANVWSESFLSSWCGENMSFLIQIDRS